MSTKLRKSENLRRVSGKLCFFFVVKNPIKKRQDGLPCACEVFR